LFSFLIISLLSDKLTPYVSEDESNNMFVTII